MKIFRRIGFLSLIILIMSSMSGCFFITKDIFEKTEVKNEKLIPITVVLDYVPNTNHTGLYVAKEKGYFEEAGLDVNIVEPADGVTSTLIATGQGDFGISYQEDVTYALASEEPLLIKAIATIIQHNTSGFGSVKSKNINSPKDFQGKVYAGWGSPAEEAVIKALVEKDGGDFSKVEMTAMDMAGYSTLENNVDFIWMFWGWDGISATRQGLDLNYMELRELDSRLDYYTPVIIANNDTLENKPEVTRAFLKATKKGYEYAVQNPDESAEIIAKFIPDADLDMLKESQEYLSSKYMEDTENWGEMKASVWEGYNEFMMESKLIDRIVPADECFTNEFLN